MEAVEKINSNTEERQEQDISLVERIIRKTENPKIAAVLALDLLLVGIDTVIFRMLCQKSSLWFIFLDVPCLRLNDLSINTKSRKTGNFISRTCEYSSG